jgi:hypothetical protein
MNKSFFCSLLLLLSMPAFADEDVYVPPKPGVWHGMIGDYPIMLCVEQDRAAYYYRGQSAQIDLDMSDSGRWTESVKGAVTGYWKIRAQYHNGNQVEGDWSKVHGKATLPIELFYLKEADSACDSSIYQQTLLIPGEPRLSLPLPVLRPMVMAGEGGEAILKANGDLWYWSTEQPQPRLISKDYVRVALGRYHFLGIKGDGSLWGWGSNEEGQLGGGEVSGDRPVHMGDDFVAIAANQNSSFAIKKDGTLWTWGGLMHDTKGNLLGEKRAKPALLGKSFVSVAAGQNSSYAAIKDDGTLWMWGSNWDGDSRKHH